jgi:hypothetical protein
MTACSPAPGRCSGYAATPAAWTANAPTRRSSTASSAYPPSGPAPAHLNHHARGHWCVENRLHWTRDVTFHEDNSQLRTGTAPRALATFRNLTLNTHRLAGRANIAHAHRDLHDRADAFAVYDIEQTITEPDREDTDREERRRGPGSKGVPPLDFALVYVSVY